MSKKLFVRLLVALSFLAAAVFFFLSVLEVEPFTEFSASWAGVIFAGVSGLALLFSAIGTKNSTQLKKMQIFLSAGLLVVALVCLISALALPDNWVLPLILILLGVMIVLSVLITGGKKWDEGDNHKVGYKNYYQRKAEEEKNKKDGE
ncbi:MAG TPA: hypothetical protein H9731_04590 [Candidatus Borkfalkia excrementipullorum]|nr:hypothetical protein [Candidatus Borkfalkia excrementipullorum]